jgi:DUF4097 and DUF4098 domain-containing protein YvlB
MRHKLMVPAVAAGLLVLAGCDIEDFNVGENGGGRYTQDFHFSFPLKSNGRLTVESFNGSIEISGWDEDTVDISGTKYARTQERADDLKVETSNTPESVTVRAIRPSEWRSNVGARFVIKVPNGSLLDRITTSNGSIRTMDCSGPAHLRTSNGGIRVEGMHGTLDAQTSNGGIDLLGVEGDVTVRSSNGHIHAEGLRGGFDARTSNGGVNAKIERADHSVRVETNNGSVELTLPADLSSDVRASTSNSGITVKLPASANARVLARTSNSSVSTDFDVKVHGEISRNHMDGVIGSGAGPLIDLTTSNGGIHLLKM